MVLKTASNYFPSVLMEKQIQVVSYAHKLFLIDHSKMERVIKFQLS